jgi:hypothetical protein
MFRRNKLPQSSGPNVNLVCVQVLHWLYDVINPVIITRVFYFTLSLSLSLDLLEKQMILAELAIQRLKYLLFVREIPDSTVSGS